jgi:predicted Zn finger-like uncharacterized protein
MPEQIRCPSCNSVLRVPESLLGKNVKCPKCETTFVAEIEELAQPEGIVRERTPAASSVPRSADEFQEELPAEDEDEDRPRSRRRRRRGRGIAAAESAVAGPAIALMVVAGLAIALCVLGLLLNLLGTGLMAAGARGGAQQSDVALNAVTGIGSAIFGLCYWSLVMVGAVKMKNLSSYGLAMTACIVAMLPCSACCLLGLPFGIWGLVVLNNPDVKDAFS